MIAGRLFFFFAHIAIVSCWGLLIPIGADSFLLYQNYIRYISDLHGIIHIILLEFPCMVVFESCAFLE